MWVGHVLRPGDSPYTSRPVVEKPVNWVNIVRVRRVQLSDLKIHDWRGDWASSLHSLVLLRIVEIS